MAFPTVAAVNGGNNPVNSTDHTVNLPSGIESGDLLLVFFASDSTPTITFPSGWIKIFTAISSIAATLGAWYRIADGTEGSTITVTTSTSQMTAHTSYRITDYSGIPEVGTAASGTSANPDPPSLTPFWGALDTLWFACQGNDDLDTVSAYPTDYTNGRNDVANASGGCGVGTARRELNAASEDPATFTLSASEEWVANIIAIAPKGFEILRPNAAGDEESIVQVVGDGVGTHYTTVDEEYADDNTSYVGNNQITYQRDLYNLPPHSIGSGAINSIRIYFRIATPSATYTAYAKPSQKSGTTVTDGTEVSKTGVTTYETFSETYTTNPATGNPYTWDEIDALQVGVQLKISVAGTVYCRCTQVYVEVDYTAVVAKPRSFGYIIG